MKIEIINNDLDYDDIDYYDLVVCGGTIYHIFYDRLICYNIKFGTVINYNFEFNICNGFYPITNKLSIYCKPKNTIMIFHDNVISEFPFKIDNLEDSCEICQCEIIDNMLIVTSENKIIIQDLLTGNIQTKNGRFRFLISPGKNHVLISFHGSYIIPFDKFIKLELDSHMSTKYYCDLGFWKNDNIVVLLNSMFNDFSDKITFIDRNMKVIKEIKYFAIFLTDPIYLVNESIYFCGAYNIWIIDSDYNLTRIESPSMIIGYSNLHEAFVGKDHKLLRIKDNGLIPCKVNYDYWHDFGISDDIYKIIQIIMELELLPLDVVNEIYIQIAKLQKLGQIIPMYDLCFEAVNFGYSNCIDR